jgi:hypothetical protein
MMSTRPASSLCLADTGTTITTTIIITASTAATIEVARPIRR